jgi:hypothetical protein
VVVVSLVYILPQNAEELKKSTSLRKQSCFAAGTSNCTGYRKTFNSIRECCKNVHRSFWTADWCRSGGKRISEAATADELAKLLNGLEQVYRKAFPILVNTAE